MIFLLIRHQQARSAILLSFKKKSTGFVNYFKLIQDFQILPLGLNPCFSTSFNQHYRRWMCILQYFTPNTTPFLQLFIKKLPLVYLFSKMTLFSYFLSEKGTISPISFLFFSCDFFSCHFNARQSTYSQ